MTQVTAHYAFLSPRTGDAFLSLLPGPLRTCLSATPLCPRWDPDSWSCDSRPHSVFARGLPRTRHCSRWRRKHLQILALKEFLSW